MRRLVRGVFPWVPLIALACGGGDDAGDDEADDSSGEFACAGEVSGDASGDFAMCGAVLVQYPDGAPVLDGRDGWLFSLVATASLGEVDPPLESIAVGFEVAGVPSAGAFALSDTVPGLTSGVVTLLDSSAFGVLVDVALDLTLVDQVLDEVQDGYRVVTFDVEGSVAMTLEGEGGTSVSVSASF